MAYIPSECSVEEYEKVIYSSDAKHRLYIKHGDTIIGTNGDNNASPFASKLTWKRRILKNGSKTITLNNFISHELDLVLHDYIIEDLTEEVEVKIGTYIDSVGDYVYVPLGMFKIQDNPKTDKNKITYKLRDFSVKFDFNYNGKPLMDANDGKATKFQVLQDICKEAGVVCNIKSFIGFNDVIGIYDNTITARTYIAYLAEQAGKMATINRQGELIFIDLNADINSIDFDTNGTVENALEREVLSLVIRGNSKQDTRSGRNLYNYEDVAWVMNECSTDKDGWITITIDNTSGTDVRYANYYTNSLNIKPSTNYNIILEVKEKTGGGGLAITSVYNGANAPEGQFPNWSLNIPEISNSSVYQQILTSRDISDDAIYGLRTFLAMGAGYSGSITFRISVLEDTTITPETFEYEPYGVSPSPEFPSEIETVGIENYFDTTKIPLETRNGITTTLQEDGGIVFNGTATADTEISYIELVSESKLKVGKEYTFSVDKPLPSGFILFIQNTNDYNWTGSISMINPNIDPNIIKETFTIPQLTGTHYKYMALIQSGTVLNNLVIYPKINKGDKQKKFVPYGNHLIVENKTANIFIPSEMTYWSNLAPSWERYGNGIKINTSSTQGGSGVYCSFAQMSNKVDGKTVTFSFSIKSSIDTKLLVGAEYLGKIVDVTTEYKRFSQTLNDFWNYDWYPFVFYNQYANGAEIYVQDMQLEIDDKESPYNECETKTITYNLQGNELVKLGNVKDELDIVTGTLTKRIGKVILNGSENWEMIGTNVAGKNRFQTNDYENKVVSNFDGNQYLNALSNKFIPTTPNETYLCKTGIASVNQYFVFFNENVYDSLENWINWLSNNPVTVYYELAQPEIIQLGPTETKTFEGTNHITLESGLETDITLEYNVPKKVNDISPDIVEKFTAGDIYKVSKVLFETGAIKYENGTDDADTLYINANNPYITNQEQLNRILIPVNGFEINSFKTGKVLGNPLIDPSDLIKVEYDGIIYKTLAQYTLNFTGTMTSAYETTVEYEAKKSNVSSIGSSEWKKYVNTQIDNVNATITTKVGEVNSAVDDVKNSVGDVSDRVAETESKINTNSDNYTALESRTTTVEQSVKGWDYKFETVTTDINGINDKVDAVDNANKKIEKYIRFVDGKIVIGTSESDLSIEISNDRISFKTGDAESAYITNNELYITDNTILNKQTLGNDKTGKWETKTDSKGNLNTRWMG